eukprot:754811-Hanusia_phi.AAC.1
MHIQTSGGRCICGKQTPWQVQGLSAHCARPLHCVPGNPASLAEEDRGRTECPGNDKPGLVLFPGGTVI